MKFTVRYGISRHYAEVEVSDGASRIESGLLDPDQRHAFIRDLALAIYYLSDVDDRDQVRGIVREVLE